MRQFLDCLGRQFLHACFTVRYGEMNVHAAFWSRLHRSANCSSKYFHKNYRCISKCISQIVLSDSLKFYNFKIQFQLAWTMFFGHIKKTPIEALAFIQVDYLHYGAIWYPCGHELLAIFDHCTTI